MERGGIDANESNDEWLFMTSIKRYTSIDIGGGTV